MEDLLIKSEEEKNARKAKVMAFIETFGRGDTGLSEIQKKARMEKLLGSEKDKVKGLGKNKDIGVDISKTDNLNIRYNPEENIKHHDPISTETIQNLDNYPNDIRAEDGKHRIVNLKVNNDGSFNLIGIIKDGNENDPKIRTIYNVESISDFDLARHEKWFIENGKKGDKAIADRTMAIHEDNGDLDLFLESPEIDTGEDEELDY